MQAASSDCLPDPVFRYVEISPVKFRAGDIVEAQFSFVTIPLKAPHKEWGSNQPPRWKLLLVLRSLALLNYTHVTVRHSFLYQPCRAYESIRNHFKLKPRMEQEIRRTDDLS